ncbi:DNA-repair protein [Nymphaea thermarum]|nr:DNA-repair protein [Nymphaea thermarum]
MANDKVGNGNGNERNARGNLPSWMGSKDKTDPAQDEVTDISSVKSGKSSSNVSKFNKKSAAQGETATKIDASCFSKFLKGVVFVLSGFVNPERSRLRSQALEMGAEYRPDWDSTCTLLVCAFPNTPKFRQVANDCGTIVSKDWVVDCYNQKKLVEIDSYLMNAGKPWRKTYLENSASHVASETVQRTPTTEVAASPISKQGELELSQYFALVKAAYERLKALRPPCQACYKTHFEQTMVAKFLAGLSPKYEVAKVQMLTGAEIPDLAEAYNRLSRLVVSLSQSQSESPSAALAVSGGRAQANRGRGSGRGVGGRGRFQCTFCGKLGHLEDRCWDKHGRPTSTSHGRGGSTSRGRGTFSSHIPVGSARVATSPGETPSSMNSENSTVTMSKAKYDQLMAQRPLPTTVSTAASSVMVDFVASTSSHEPGTMWIIDSGASKHFAVNLTYLLHCIGFHNLNMLGLPMENCLLLWELGMLNFLVLSFFPMFYMLQSFLLIFYLLLS